MISIPAPNPSSGARLRIEGPETCCVASLSLWEALPNQSQSVRLQCVPDVALSSPRLGYLGKLLQSSRYVAGTGKAAPTYKALDTPRHCAKHL